MSKPSRVVLFPETGMFGGEFYIEALAEGGIGCWAFPYVVQGLLQRQILRTADLIVAGLVVDWIEPGPDSGQRFPVPSGRYDFYGFDLLEQLRVLLGSLDRVAVMSTVTEELRETLDTFQIPEARRLHTTRVCEAPQIRAAFKQLLKAQSV